MNNLRAKNTSFKTGKIALCECEFGKDGNDIGFGLLIADTSFSLLFRTFLGNRETPVAELLVCPKGCALALSSRSRISCDALLAIDLDFCSCV